MVAKCCHFSFLCKQQFNILGFMAVTHWRFTVIACREIWTRKTLLKIIGVLSSVKLNKLPTRGDSIWTNQSQWHGTQIKKMIDFPPFLCDPATLHNLQTNLSCSYTVICYSVGWNVCNWWIFFREITAILLRLLVNHKLNHRGLSFLSFSFS